MKTKNQILSLNIFEGCAVEVFYLGMKVIGLFKEVDNEKITLVESTIIKIPQREVKCPSIKLNQEFDLRGIDKINLIPLISHYKYYLEYHNLKSQNLNYYLNSNKIISYITNADNFKNLIVSEFSVKFKIKTNPTKANWVSISFIPEQNLYQLELTSEYFDKSKQENISNIKLSKLVDNLNDISKELYSNQIIL